jgi:Protein of unknown function (DUF3298)
MLRRSLSLIIAIAGLAGCQHGSQDTAQHAPSPAHAAAKTAKDSESQENLYTVEIHLPEMKPEWAPLAAALQAYVNRQKQALLTALNDPTAREQARMMPWDLNLDISVDGRTADLINVQVEGSSFTGGAHPVPIIDSFTYDIQRQKLITLADLFTDQAAAEKVFAAESRRQLLTGLDDEEEPLASSPEQIREGTEPGKNHYKVFALLTGEDGKARGLTFIFPPYQVAPYVAGTQAVDVPASRFVALLKPEYRGAFR